MVFCLAGHNNLKVSTTLKHTSKDSSVKESVSKFFKKYAKCRSKLII